ncbi:PAS/PAC sensor-containing diguanylate cyclase/phosphodiesterase [Bacillus freudenreichii]|nr:PAS/PAC sensor-containing diguanylate cyclase/phosphodiesterase [Bacillus freudenreichii]
MLKKRFKNKQKDKLLLDDIEKLETLLYTMPDMIIFKDGDGRWINTNQYTLSLFGLEDTHYLGRTSAELALIKPFYQELFLTCQKHNEMVWKSRKMTRNEVKFLRQDGREVIYDVITKPIFNADRSKKALIVIGRDITERKRIEEQNFHLAYNDQLTKLPNRLKLEKQLNKSIIASKILKQQFVVMFLGLDRFSYINDHLGPAIGDQLLIQSSDRLQQCIPTDWFLARIGGDEFAILVPNSEVESALNVVQNIIHLIGKPFLLNGYELFITTSIGVCSYPQDGDDAQTLMKHANIALRSAEEKGKNRYQIFSSTMDVAAFKTFSLENSLNKAMGMEQFELYYQPKIDIQTNKIVGAEALIRWNHPEWDLVSPNEFIPLAEETGLIIPMGKWVKETVCRQNKEWEKAGLQIVPIAVNISAKRFMQKEFVKSIKRILNESQLEPGFLEIEITETSLMENEELAVEIINQLGDLGLKVSLDDFGTGYSAFSYLKRFKVDTIKIDRDFIKEIGINEQDEMILIGIISLIKSLKINVIAEGVETEEQLNFLRKQECNQAQGYLYSRPVSAGEFKELLRKGTIDIHVQNKEINQEFIERRKYFRINLIHPLSADMTIIKFMGKDITLGRTEVLINDIGLGGLSFVSNIKIAVRPDVILSIETELFGEIIEFVGRIVWSKELNEDAYHYGFEFMVDEDERAAIAKMVNNLRVKLRKNSLLPDCRFIAADINAFFNKKR